MENDNNKRFYNVQMPAWYRGVAWAVRFIGLVVMAGGALMFQHNPGLESLWGISCIFTGLFLLTLPSLPKAGIEQWTRIKGLRDGSLLADLDNKKKDEKV